MSYINVQRPRDEELLASHNLPVSKYEKILSTVKKANDSYFHLSEMYEHFYKMLSTSDILINSYVEYRFMSQKDKQEWVKIKDTKTGDRGYVNRHLTTELKQAMPEIYDELIGPRISERTESLELSDDIDALLLSSGVPAYFEYLEKLAVYKKGVFSQLRRGYISFLQVKSIHLISHFLKAFEQDRTVLENALLNNRQIQAWPRMGELVSQICERVDPGHHDPLSLHAVNCLRSIYVSAYNIALDLLQSGKHVPLEIRQFLPIIPDKIDFTKSRLEKEGAWQRYQDHIFLFMRLPIEQKARLGECLSNLTPVQKAMWMGCLGKVEIRALVLPMISQYNHFENLAGICREIPESDIDNYPFVSRVWGVLSEIYAEHMLGKTGVSAKINELFDHVSRQKPALSIQAEPQGVADLSVIQNLSFLVVDDSDRIRQMTTKVLKDAGVRRISESVNGAEAWEYIQNHPLDVILCDWIMPELSGIELIQRMMQVETLARKITFLMLTTVNDKASIVEALSVGVRGYLIKPFSRKQLLEKVFFATEWLRKEQQSWKISADEESKRSITA